MADNRRSLVQISGAALQVLTKALVPIGRHNVAGSPEGPSRPLLGGAQTGYHYQPVSKVDEVVLLGETEWSWHTTSVSTARPSQMYLLADGESIQLGGAGQVLHYAQNNGGVYSSVGGSTLVIDHLGNITYTLAAGKTLTIVGPTTIIGNLNITGAVAITGTLTVNGVAVETGVDPPDIDP